MADNAETRLVNFATIVEVALITATEPLTEIYLKNLIQPAATSEKLKVTIEQLQLKWHNGGLELVQSDFGWRFKVKKVFMDLIPHLIEAKTPKYSKAVLETLSIIAYKQPVTRQEIESIRGVAVSTHIMQTLVHRGWIEIAGYKDSIGKPALWTTTPQFLIDFHLNSLTELPPLANLTHLLAD